MKEEADDPIDSHDDHNHCTVLWRGAQRIFISKGADPSTESSELTKQSTDTPANQATLLEQNDTAQMASSRISSTYYINPNTGRRFNSTSITTHIATFGFKRRDDEDAAREHILEHSKKLLSEQAISKLHGQLLEAAEAYITSLKEEFPIPEKLLPSWASTIFATLEKHRTATLAAISGIILVQINTQNARCGEWYKQRRRRSGRSRSRSPRTTPIREESHGKSSSLPPP
jgi:hypothetical protein